MLSHQILIYILLTTLSYMLIALSFKSIYLTSKFFNLTHAISLILGAYLVYTCVILCKSSFVIAIPLSIIVCVLLALAINKFVYVPLQKRGCASWQIMIASLGLYIVLQNIISMIWGDSIISFRTWTIKPGYEFLGAHITNLQIITITVSLVLLLFYWLFIEKTNIGNRIRAVSSNADLSAIFGISKDNVVVWALVAGTAMATCAGILIAADNDMIPTMGFNWLLYAVVAMIIGGIGKMRHILLGALLLATTQHFVAYYFDSKWMNAAAYIILITFLYLRPTGFSGTLLKKTNI